LRQNHKHTERKRDKERYGDEEALNKLVFHISSSKIIFSETEDVIQG
jgi:hypothetical protein